MLITTFLKSKFPHLEGTLSKLIWQIPIIILVVLLLIGFIYAPYKIYKEKNGASSNFATPDALLGPHLENIDFRIVDLAREDLTIQDRTIAKCRIYGPAVLLIKSCTFRNCEFAAVSKDININRTSIYIPTPESPLIQGVISVENVDFRNCKFKKIAFMGPDQLKRDLFINL